MGNIFCGDAVSESNFETDDENKYNNVDDSFKNILVDIKRDLKELNSRLENTQIRKAKSEQSLNNFIDKWYEETKDKNVIGKNIPFVGSVEELEKSIYKKNVKLFIDILEEFLGYNDL